MTKLDKLYRKAPQLESPAKLDDRTLRVARSRMSKAPVKPDLKLQRNSKWWGVGYAVSYLCVFGIGLGVLLQAGFFPLGREVAPVASNTAATNELAGSESDDSQLQIVLLERSRVAQDDSRVQMRKTAPLDAAEAAVTSPAVTSAPMPGSPVAPPPVSNSTAGSKGADAHGSVSIESMADAETTSAVSTPVGASRSIAEFSNSEPQDLTASVASGLAESAVEPASVASTEFSSTEISSIEITRTDAANANAVSNEAVVTDLNRARIQSQLQEELPAQGNVLLRNQQLPESQSAMTKRSIDWLLSQPADQFTVMVAVGSTADSLTLLGNELSIATELVQINDDKNGWLLLHGSFSNSLNAELVLPGLFSVTYAADAAVDTVDSFMKLEVVRYSQLQGLLK